MNLLLLILKLFPVLLAAIQAVESAAPVAKIGPQKLTLVKTVAASVYQEPVTDMAISQDRLLALIEAITAQIVAFYNLVGIFKKSS